MILLGLRNVTIALDFRTGTSFQKIRGAFVLHILQAHYYELNFRIKLIDYNTGYRTTTGFIDWKIPVEK